MIFIFSLLFVLVASVCFLAVGGATLASVIDVPSFFVVMATVFTVLIATNSVKDFFHGLKIASSKKVFSSLEISNSKTAVSLVINSLLCMSGFVLFFCLPVLFSMREQKGSMGPVLAVCMITFFYTAELLIVLLPVKFSLMKKLRSQKKQVEDNMPEKKQEENLGKKLDGNKFPGQLYVVIISGFIVLFVFLLVSSAFVLSNLMPGLLVYFPLNILWIAGISYLFLIPSGLFKAFFRALKTGFSVNKKEFDASNTTGKLSEFEDSIKALDFVLMIQFALAIFGAVLLCVVTMSTVNDKDSAWFNFSVSSLMIAVPFLGSIFLLSLRARIEKLMNGYSCV